MDSNEENLNGYDYRGPFDKDVIDEEKVKNQEPILSERDFIQESRKPSRFPAWLWLFLITIIAALLWGTSNWYEHLIYKTVSSKRFLEVTNRDFSLFLWQFPSFLRSNVKQKTGYLTGFEYENKETLNLGTAEEFVTAPPDLLFLYHTWNRLLASDFIARPISSSDFLEFLEQVPEWKPQHWAQAPKEYISFVKALSSSQTTPLQTLPLDTLPLSVRMAFQGWKNYFKEGPLINEMTPTIKEVEAFLNEHPTYARNYWRNIETVAGQKIAGSHYLEDFLSITLDKDKKVPTDQVSSFLRVALFNAQQAKEGK